jgi:hypothetical protein
MVGEEGGKRSYETGDLDENDREINKISLENQIFHHKRAQICILSYYAETTISLSCDAEENNNVLLFVRYKKGSSL